MSNLKPNSWLTKRIVIWIETITPSCKDMTYLLSQSMDRRLVLHKRLTIWLHLRICDGCTRFAENLAFIRKASRSILGYAEKILPTRLPDSAKERIKEGITPGPDRGLREPSARRHPNNQSWQHLNLV